MSFINNCDKCNCKTNFVMAFNIAGEDYLLCENCYYEEMDKGVWNDKR